MAVVSTGNPKYHLWTHKRAGALPIGYWYASVTGTGNGTGGLHTFRIQPATQKECEELLFSLEDASLQYNAGLVSTGMEMLLDIPMRGTGVTHTHKWAVTWRQPEGLVLMLTDRITPPRYIWPARDALWTLDMFSTNNNIVDGLGMAWGYLWDANKATKVPAGPRRPDGASDLTHVARIPGGGS